MDDQISQLKTDNAKYIILCFQIIYISGAQHLLKWPGERCYFISVGTYSASHRLIKRVVGEWSALWRNMELIESTFCPLICLSQCEYVCWGWALYMPPTLFLILPAVIKSFKLPYMPIYSMENCHLSGSYWDTKLPGSCEWTFPNGDQMLGACGY